MRMRFPGHEKAKFHKGVPEGWEVEKINKLGKIINRENAVYEGGKIL